MRVSRVLIRLLQISYKLNMAFAAYLLENAMLVLARGGAFAHVFYAPPWGFRMNRPAPPLGIFSFSKKMKKDKCRGEGGVG